MASRFGEIPESAVVSSRPIGKSIEAAARAQDRVAYERSRSPDGGPAMSSLELAGYRTLVQAGIGGFVREYRFAWEALRRRWRFDFAWLVEGVAVEMEGGTFTEGRHVRGAAFREDCRKYNAAAMLGWTLLRFTIDDVEDGTMVADIERALEIRRHARHDKPPVHNAEGLSGHTTAPKL